MAKAYRINPEKVMLERESVPNDGTMETMEFVERFAPRDAKQVRSSVETVTSGVVRRKRMLQEN